ncbi:MAG: VOC family protein [Solirubrobacteraceae bacterium]|nr:VOC family protein [Solirubrobacteraceae bacterium]
MLATTEAFSSFAVDDMEAARRFYGETLGIDTESIMDGYLLTLKLHGGARPTMIYTKPDVRPGNATVLNFPVEDLEAAVDGLASRGVTFERYDGFEHDERGISGGGDDGPRIAWFTDPAGNILALIEERGMA